MASIEKIEDLVAWKKARELTRIVYEITKTIAFSKDFALRDQARRSAISVASNIAEGFGRGGSKEFLQFLSMSKGSLYELKTQLCIASDLKYITSDDFRNLNELYRGVFENYSWIDEIS